MLSVEVRGARDHEMGGSNMFGVFLTNSQISTTYNHRHHLQHLMLSAT